MTPERSRDLESKVLFALEHPAARTDRGTLARLLGAPDPMRQVLDSWDGGERVLLGILLKGGGPTDASQLIVLGCRTPLGGEAFSRFLDEAERRVEPGDGEGYRALDVVLSPPLGCMGDLMKGRGYSDHYAYLSFVAEVPSTIEPDDPDWRDVDASNVDAAYACYSDAFLATGAPVASPEDSRAAMLGADPRPRVLLAEGNAAAVLRVAWRDEAARRGELRFVCRNLGLRGQRVGDRALSETFRVLRRMGASSVQLDVASTNRAALELYDRWGFRRVEQEDVLRIALPGIGSARDGKQARAASPSRP
jgi:ribosomal protein S18 acetylase RimI-like enzyme